MLPRRLILVTGGGASLTPPETTPTDAKLTLTSAPHGGWSEPQRPKAVYHAGSDKTFISWVAGQSGDVEVAAYDHATATMGSAFVLHAALGGEGTADLHDNPSVLVRSSDSKVLLAYCRHADSTVRTRLSSSALDVSAFAAEVSLDASLGGAVYDYPCLFQLSNGTIYLFYRDFVGGTTAELTYSTSTDGGATWSSGVTLYKNPNKSTYWQIAQHGDQIHVVVQDLNPDEGANTAIYHFYLSGGNRYKSDGTQITAATPMGPSDLTVADPSTDGAHQLYDLVFDADGHPVVATTVWTTRYSAYKGRRVSWTGSAWEASDAITVTSGVPATPLLGMAIDPLDTNVLYMTRYVGTDWIIERHTYSGGSWSATDISADTANDHLYPISVVGADPSLRILWMTGTYTSYTNWNTGITGWGAS